MDAKLIQHRRIFDGFRDEMDFGIRIEYPHMLNRIAQVTRYFPEVKK
jgi:hypothetical protein